MNRKVLGLALAGLLSAGTGTAIACEFKAGVTKFLDYAYCRYGENAVVVVELPESVSWEKCIYHAEPFSMEKLLAVTRDENGKEVLSINDRSQLGNPCYMTKRHCDAALRAFKAGG